MTKGKILIGVAGTLVVLGGAYFLFRNEIGFKKAPPSTEENHVAPKTADAPPDQASPKFPVKPSGPESSGLPLPKTLPVVDESDQTLQDALSLVWGKGGFESLVNLKDLVRRVVVYVDSASKTRPVPVDATLFIPPDGDFIATGKDDNRFINKKNYARYQPYVTLIEKVDAEKFSKIYLHFYPLFQAAYRDINPQGYFNDRLVEALDTAIATPEVDDPIQLTYTGTYFKYSDSSLEGRPSAQKLLLRIGVTHSKLIKAKLKEFRRLIAGSRE
jgi:hypothetical protein